MRRRFGSASTRKATLSRLALGKPVAHVVKDGADSLPHSDRSLVPVHVELLVRVCDARR